jgi:hypothetical protein
MLPQYLIIRPSKKFIKISCNNKFVEKMYSFFIIAPTVNYIIREKINLFSNYKLNRYIFAKKLLIHVKD